MAPDALAPPVPTASAAMVLPMSDRKDLDFCVKNFSTVWVIWVNIGSGNGLLSDSTKP